MAGRTLLDMVQGILSTLDSDTVNDISDTVESQQVAMLCRQVFYDIVEEYHVPKHRTLGSLEGVGDVTKPTHLKLPSDVSAMSWLKYNIKEAVADQDEYRDLIYLDPKSFVDKCNMRDSLDTTNSKVINIDNNVRITVGRKEAPKYWTSFDDTYIVCDSYDVDIDTTLQASKTQAYFEKLPSFQLENDFVPVLPEQLSSLFYRTAENEAYAIYKQTINPKLERKEHAFRIRAQRNKYKATDAQSNFFDTGVVSGRNAKGRVG